MGVNDSNYLKELFIDEAKPAMDFFNFHHGIVFHENNSTIHRAYINVSQKQWKYYEDASLSIRVPIEANVTYSLRYNGYTGFIRIAFVKESTDPVDGTSIALYNANGTSDIEFNDNVTESFSYDFTVTNKDLKYIIIQIAGGNGWETGDSSKLWAQAAKLKLHTLYD